MQTMEEIVLDIYSRFQGKFHYLIDNWDPIRFFLDVTLFLNLSSHNTVSLLDFADVIDHPAINLLQDYEEFYIFLMKLASIVYSITRSTNSSSSTSNITKLNESSHDYDESTLALDYFIKEFAVPKLDVTWDVMLSQFTINVNNHHDIEILQSLSDFSQFFQLWYASLVLEGFRSLRHTPVSSTWSRLCKSRKLLARRILNAHVQILLSKDIIPHLYISQFIDHLGSRLGLSLTDFVLFVLFIIKQLQLSERLQDTEFITSQECLYYLLDIVSQTHFYPCYLQNHKTSLPTNEFIWLLRNCGYTQSVILIDKVLMLSKTFHHHSTHTATQGTDDTWDVVKLPLVLTKVLQVMKTIESKNQTNNSGSSSSHVTAAQLSEYRKFTYLALHLPTAIFAPTTAPPSLLKSLFTTSGCECVKDSHGLIAKVFKYCRIAEDVFRRVHAVFECDRLDHMVTYRSFIKLTEDVHILGSVIPVTIVRHAFEYLLHPLEIEMYYVSMGDMLEVLFVLAQAMFNRTYSKSLGLLDSSFASALPESASMLYSEDPLDCFRSLLLLYDEGINTMLEVVDVDLDHDSCCISDVTAAKYSDASTLHASEFRILHDDVRPADSHATPGHDKDVYQGPSSVDLLVILMLFPLNSSTFNPWRLFKVFSQHIQISAAVAYHDLNNSATLLRLFADVVKEFKMDTKALVAYFASLYVGKKHLPHLLRQGVRETLRDLEYVALEGVVHLLQRNADLLVFEFLRCCSRYSSALPGLATLDMLESDQEAVTLTTEGAVLWAQDACSVSAEQATPLANSVLGLSGSSSMFFSQFIVFAVKCFALSESDSELGEGAKYISAAKVLVTKLTERLNALNCLLGVNALDMALSPGPVRSLSPACLASVYSCALQLFSKHHSCTPLTDTSLPPRAPPQLWDAPRWLDFCKYINIAPDAPSLHDCWAVFGVYLRGNGFVSNTSRWSADTVPPSPMSVSVHHLLELLSAAAYAFQSTSRRRLSPVQALEAITLRCALPVIALSADVCLDSRPQSRAGTSAVLGDLVRFGGDNVLHFLHNEGLFLWRVFQKTFDNSAAKVSMNALIKYLTLDGELPTHQLYSAITRVLDATQLHLETAGQAGSVWSSRRTSQLSFSEFQEIVLRYAYELWHVYKLNIASVDAAEPPSKGPSSVVEAYLQQCLSVALDPDLRRTGSWGVNFITSYLFLLKSEYGDLVPSDDVDPLGTQGDDDSELFMFEGRGASLGPPVELFGGSPFAEALPRSVQERIDAVTETVWPVYATYCSCGDSLNPGRLSGPNLLTILCKLDLLTPSMSLSDLGILVHLVSSHSIHHANVVIASHDKTQVRLDSPSLSFEEFLVFLCTFAQLKYGSPAERVGDMHSSVEKAGVDYAQWLRCWQEIIAQNSYFHRLLSDSVVPLFAKHPTFHNVEDARVRDRFVLVFSIDVLLLLQELEQELKCVFEVLELECEEANEAISHKRVMALLTAAKIVPYLISPDATSDILLDLDPTSGSRSGIGSCAHWSYVVAIVANECVDKSIETMRFPCTAERKKTLICERLTAITTELGLALGS